MYVGAQRGINPFPPIASLIHNGPKNPPNPLNNNYFPPPPPPPPMSDDTTLWLFFVGGGGGLEVWEKRISNRLFPPNISGILQCAHYRAQSFKGSCINCWECGDSYKEDFRVLGNTGRTRISLGHDSKVRTSTLSSSGLKDLQASRFVGWPVNSPTALRAPMSFGISGRFWLRTNSAKIGSAWVTGP